MPGLMFLPGIGWARTATRAATFLVPLAAWALLLFSESRPFGRRFAPVPWLAACAVWLVLSVLHPETNGLLSGTVEAALSISVMAPAFWMNRQAPMSTRRVRRLLVLMFAISAFSSVLGIAQFYRPGTFDPQDIPLLRLSVDTADSRFFEDAHGRKVLRPCGLSDTPGMASVAGASTFVLGMGLVLVAKRFTHRAAYLALAAAGIGVIYVSHARAMLLISIGGIGCLGVLLALRRDFTRLALLMGLGVVVFIAGLMWALREGGASVANRFATLLSARPTDVYQSNRGRFLAATLTNLVPVRPLGAGMGRWGQPNAYFGTNWGPGDPRGPIVVEIQWTGWAVDGGAPLMLGYGAALIVAVVASLRVVFSRDDRELADVATIFLAINLQAIALTFSGLPFSSSIGVLFWSTAAAADTAHQQLRARQRSAALLQAAIRART